MLTAFLGRRTLPMFSGMLSAFPSILATFVIGMFAVFNIARGTLFGITRFYKL